MADYSEMSPSAWVMRCYNQGASLLHMRSMLETMIENMERGSVWPGTASHDSSVARLKAIKAYQLIGLPDRKPTPDPE